MKHQRASQYREPLYYFAHISLLFSMPPSPSSFSTSCKTTCEGLDGCINKSQPSELVHVRADTRAFGLLGQGSAYTEPYPFRRLTARKARSRTERNQPNHRAEVLTT